MKTTPLLITAIAVLAITYLPACQTQINDVREGPSPGVRVRSHLAPYATVGLNRAVIVDKSLEDWHGPEGRKRGKIAVEKTGSRRTETGSVEAWALLRNRTDHPFQIEGRVQFFDESEAPIGGPSAWQRIFLGPNSVATYRENSTNTDRVRYYYIEIREGR
jgi:hypothetical protein